MPHGVLAILPGDGAVVGRALVADRRVAGVVFTGSTATAQAINRALAARDGAIATLVAETGGINVMIVDSSALLEQAVSDIMVSAFDSARAALFGPALRLCAGGNRRRFGEDACGRDCRTQGWRSFDPVDRYRAGDRR